MKNRSLPQHGFTVAELLVVVTIIAALAALIMPALGRVQADARSLRCANFLRQLGSATLLYAGDHDMNLPVTSHQKRTGVKPWTETLQEYASGTVTFRCPCDEDPTRLYTYVINDYLTPNPDGAPDLDFSKLARLERPPQTLLFAEAAKDFKDSDHFHFSEFPGAETPPEAFARQVAVTRHSGSANYLFADGHLETLSWPQVQPRLSARGTRLLDPR